MHRSRSRLRSGGAGGGGVDGPTIVTLTPFDGQGEVAVDIPALTVTFSEQIQFGTTVSIRLYKTTGDVLVQEWTEADVVGGMIDSDTLEIVPDLPLEDDVEYYVRIDAGSIKDLAGNSFAGINDNTTWDFSTGAAVEYGAEAVALFAAMSVAPDDTRKGHINTLIDALKAAGIWAKVDVLWVLAAHDSQAARLNWKDPATFTLSEVSSPTFTTDRGYAGNGSSSYLNTGWDAATNGSQYTQNASHGMVWNRTSRAANTSAAIGARSSTGTDEITFHLRFTGDLLFTRLLDNNSSVSNASSDGMFVGSRTSSTSRTSYRNGSAVGSAVTATAQTIHALDIYIGARNTNGTASNFSTDQHAAASLGGSLSSGEVSDYHTALAAYMTAVGA